MACEDRARAAMIDAAKLAEELRAEQDVTAKAEYARKMADAQIKDLQNKVIICMYINTLRFNFSITSTDKIIFLYRLMM